MTTTITSPVRATWKEWVGLAVLMVPVFMMATDLTVLYLATPAVSADLAPTSTQLLWILHIADFMAVGFVLTMGRLGERIGRRRLLTIGVAVYGLASIAAAYATSPELLIAGRALLGVAAATMMPSIIGLLRSMFPDPKQFGLAIAINLSAFSAGAALGPPLGGLLLEFFWWGAVFLANVPAAVLLLAAVWLLPTFRDESAGRIDLWSVALSLAAILAIIYGLQEIAVTQQDGTGTMWPYVGVVVAGAAIGSLFIWRQLRLADPLIDLRLFRTAAFTVSLLAVMGVLLAAVGTDMLFAQYLQAVLGLPTAQAGLWLMVPAVASVLGTMLAPVLTRWLRPAYAMALGLAVAIAGAAAAVAMVGRFGPAMLIVAISAMALGVGPTMTLAANLMVSSAPHERAGSAAAMNDVSAGFGQGLSVAFLGSLAMVVYRLNLELPDELGDRDMDVAQESVGGAVAVAAEQPRSIEAAVLDTAQASFAQGLQLAYAAAAGLLLLVAALVMWRLRHTRLAESTTD